MSNFSMCFRSILFVALLVCPASAQTEKVSAPFYQLTNTLLANDPVLGAGIEMVFQVDELPEGGLTGTIAQRDFGIICKTWAQNVITHAATVAKAPPPKFLIVHVKHGGIVGTYVKMRFSTDGKQCLAWKE
jgi:hypothetical protein